MKPAAMTRENPGSREHLAIGILALALMDGIILLMDLLRLCAGT